MAIANITNNILTDSGVATSALQIALNGTGFVKISGTTISYDNSTYALDSAVVKLTGTQTVGGAKTFSTYSKFDGGVILKNNVSASLAGYVGLSAYSASGNKGINIDFDTYSASFYFSGTLPYQYTFPAATGTIALTTDLSGYVTLATTQTISGAKTFTSTITATQINLGGGAGQNQLQSAANNDFILSNSGNFRIINNSNTVALLTITNAGAATFSSTLGINGVSNNVTSGTYTPTASAFLNCSAVSASNGKYIRVGNIVNVTMDATATFSSTVAGFYVSIPVGGVFTGGGYSGQGFAISTAGAVVANGPVSPEYNTTNVLCSIYVDYPSATTLNFVITFQYRVE